MRQTRQEMPRRMAVAEYCARETSWATCSPLTRYFSCFCALFLVSSKNHFVVILSKLSQERLLYRVSFGYSAAPELVQGSAPHSDPRTLWERHPCAWCHLGRKATPGCCMVKSSSLFDLCSHQSLHWKLGLFWTESIYDSLLSIELTTKQCQTDPQHHVA
jgi:hypothetical protein